jgi:hypothetical protein
MGRVLSIDLACRSKNLGICLLTASGNSYSARFLSSSEFHIADPLSRSDFAKLISTFCHEEGIRVLLVDGPQAWKDPDSEWPHCRVCEKELATPAKTGTEGVVKPHTWVRFVRFSIELFDSLTKECGAQLAEGQRLEAPQSGLLALESFPTSAWRALRLRPLPAKRKCTRNDLTNGAVNLKRLYDLTLISEPTHDELQALVAALAGPAILDGNPSGYRVHGTAPVIRNRVRVEGYIVNPACEATGSVV